MNKIIRIYQALYRSVILPVILLAVAFFVLFKTLGGENLIDSLLQPWGLTTLLMIISVVYIENIFTTPRDGLINSLNASIISIVFWEGLRVNFWISLLFSASVLISGLVYLIVYDRKRKINLISKYASRFGRAKVIFPIVASLSFINFTLSNQLVDISVSSDIFYFLAYYVVFLILTSHNVIEKIKHLPSTIFNFIIQENIGIVKGNQAPNIVLVEFNTSSGIKINDLVVLGHHNVNSKKLIIDKLIENQIGLVIDFLGTQSERDVITARLYLLNEPQRDLSPIHSGLVKINQECQIVIDPIQFVDRVKSERVKYFWKRRDDIVALVTVDSNINVLNAEIIRHKHLENAQLVSSINDSAKAPVRYQIIEAETHKEGLQSKKDHGFTQFKAYQLGAWRKPSDENNLEIPNAFKRFFEFQWVPDVNSLLFQWNRTIDGENAKESVDDETGHHLLGTIPNTNLPIYLNINDLVSHHTAILGVTGTGKTTLVIKLLQGINENNIFTVCLDITGEYRNKISDFEEFFDVTTDSLWTIEIDKILDARKRTQYGFTDPNKLTKEDAGKLEDASITKINEIIKDRIEVLRTTKKLVILDIPEISNTYYSLDFTQYVIQAILNYAKDVYVKNLTATAKDNFRCCLVLEEAHTLVPENLGVGGDYGASKAVIDKISQIALQGRKYNVGFILVSQRTATVKKTVLNQCNTMIAFRAYDETSFTFLANYFGSEYVREIIHLKNDGDSRYVIVAGKAVVADRPIIVEIKK